MAKKGLIEVADEAALLLSAEHLLRVRIPSPGAWLRCEWVRREVRYLANPRRLASCNLAEMTTA